MAQVSMLLVLAGTAALPAFLVYLWFRLSRFRFSLPWFLCSLIGGIAAVFIALIMGFLFEGFFAALGTALGGRLSLKGVFTAGNLPASIFRAALVEESSRLVVLFPLFAVFRRLKWGFGTTPGGSVDCCAAGLAGGLGFALAETASYGAANMGAALLRAFTAAPLHGACGGRAGLAAAAFRDNPAAGILRFLSAAAIHGMYNFLILRSGLSSVIAVLAASSFFVSSLVFIRRSPGWNGEKGGRLPDE
ncbi:MAG: PrsW family intramembrane metalloprotease [Treponema sp.]|jgi:RsiW-degrading membrane proteinase PrsW (M82 family)|nr:PrsW family intramembrane metalloprotease [Treponema sp.]